MGFREGAWGNYLMLSDSSGDAEWGFSAYEAVRHRLPDVDFSSASRRIENLSELVERMDVFLLDAFGVLNIGEEAIPGAPERVRELQAAGKTVFVVSNAAGYPKSLMLEKNARLGFDFAPEHVLTSREVLLAAVSFLPRVKYGLVASKSFGLEELEHLDGDFLEDDPGIYDQSQAFLMLGCVGWTDQRQHMLETTLRANPRPVLVGNPDIVAPRKDGLSRQLGYFAHRLADATGISPEFFGKPYGNVFETALSRLPAGTDLTRVVMVGDTLHTDILGGRNAGVKTALVTGFGALAGMDADEAIVRSGIVPDYIMPGP